MIVSVRSVSLTYQSADGEVEALKEVSFDINEGEFISLVGPSGCGKSTLLSIIAGLERPTSGTVYVDGEAVTGPSEKIGFMPQKDQLFPWRTIWGNVTLGPELRKQKDASLAESLLERYGLSDFKKKTPSQLSGGMRQRCALIRTLATDPKILLLDEPFSALDYQTRLSVSADIHGIICNEKKTALLVTHDISEAVSLSDRIVVLSKRPGQVKDIYDLTDLKGLSPMERRSDSRFKEFFNEIWKELDINV